MIVLVNININANTALLPRTTVQITVLHASIHNATILLTCTYQYILERNRQIHSTADYTVEFPVVFRIPYYKATDHF